MVKEEPRVNPPTPYFTDWGGTTWIIREPAGKAPKSFPGYRGFHLSADGRFLLINLETATGDRWSSEDNLLHFEVLDGVADIPIEGSFRAYQADDGGGPPGKLRLVPEEHPESEGLVFEEARAQIGIVENHWIPKKLEGGSHVMWPMNREIHLMLLPDGSDGYGVLGYGGVNRFRGGVSLQENQFVTGPLARTRRSGPADDFENLFLQRISETTRYILVDKDLFFYNETKFTAAFRVQIFE